MKESIIHQTRSTEESDKARKLEQSLERFAILLAGIRYLFLFSGVAFVTWKAFEVSILGTDFTSNIFAEVLIVGIVLPGLIWGSTYWGERQAREVIRARRELAASTRLAQYEADQRHRIELVQQKEDAALAEIGRIISSSLNVDEVYDRFAEQVAELIPFDRISVGLIDIERDLLEMAYISGTDVSDRSQGDVIPLSSTLSLEVAKRRRGIIVQPETEDEIAADYPALLPSYRSGMKSVLAVPLLSADKVIGTLQFRSEQTKAYTRRHLTMGERVANQISGAIANSQLHAAIQRQVEDRDALAEISRVMNSSLEINEVYERFVEQVSKLIPSDRVCISIANPASGTFDNVYVNGIDVPERRQGDVTLLGGSITMDATDTKSTILMQSGDAGEIESRYPGLLPAYEVGLRSFLSTPVISDDEPIGVLHFRSKRPNAYNSRHIALAENVSAQIASAIANSQLHRAVQRHAQEREALAEIGRIISSSLEIEEVFDDFTGAVQNLITFDSIAVSLIDLNRGRVVDAYVNGQHIEGMVRGIEIPLKRSVDEAVTDNRAGVILQPDDSADVIRQYPDLEPIVQAGVRSFIVVPLFSNDSPMGALHIRSTNPKAYTERHLALAEAVAAQVSGALTNSQLYAERMRAEDALARAATQLTSANAELETEVGERKRYELALKEHSEELTRSNKELEQFAYIASHDLQEPLRMVSSYTQLLARRYKEKLDDDAIEFIDYAVDGVNRMQRLIEDLLAYSRVGTRGNDFESIDLATVVDAALANLKFAIQDNEASVTHDELPTIVADASQLTQLLQNLIGNALKFKRPDEPPHVHLSANKEGGGWLFTVKDNGIGIHPDYKERIFAIFQRLHTRDEYPGTGIGLAICKKIVDRHGGRIWVESEPGQGAVFNFTISDNLKTEQNDD